MKKILLILLLFVQATSPHTHGIASLGTIVTSRSSAIAKNQQLGLGLNSSFLSLWLRPELLLVSAQFPQADNGQSEGF